MKKHLLFLLFSLPFLLNGQQASPTREFTAVMASVPITVDGNLDEACWGQAVPAQAFRQYFPLDSAAAISRTEVRMAYDEQQVYFAAILYDSLPGDYITLSLRRDFRVESVDALAIVIDPFMDGTNGFFFGANPYGVQVEGLVSNGGQAATDLDLSWDNKWYVETKRQVNAWTLEMAIPLKTLRFAEGSARWGVNVIRYDTKFNERSAWSPVPRQFELFNLACTGVAIFPDPLGKPGANVSVIPYLAGATGRDHLSGADADHSLAIGGDAKIAITPSLNLDITVNPDFSQVEVDVQQTNLDRFELFFPERRQFFLENADLFASFGFVNARPFFSRRIGITIDSATGQNVQNDILLGGRLSGRLNERWRLGLMNIQTAREPAIGAPSYNYSVAALQRQIGTRSNVSAVFVNKENFDQQPVDIQRPGDGSYNRLAGIDYNLASADGKWGGKAFWHQTFGPANTSQAFSHGATLNYNARRFFIGWTHQWVGAGFDAKVGFVPRTDFRRVNPVIGLNFFPDSRRVNRHQFLLSNNWIWNETWGVTDYNLTASWTMDFQNTARYSFFLLSNYVKLFFPFNPTGNPEQLFLPGQSFSQTGFLTSFQSDQRKPVNFLVQVISGAFFNGNLRQLSGAVNYRYREYANVALAYNINRINLKEGFDDATLLLIGPRFDITFGRNLFWTTFVQYNNQFDNLNINSRLQWRFRPVSDLFLVYTDNYFPDNWKVKNRALVLKVNFWLNM